MKFPDLSKFPHISVDTETTGLKWWIHKVFGISISTPDGKDYYWDIRKTPQVIEWLNNELKRVKLIIFANAKFDMHMLREIGVHVPGDRVDDVIVRAALIDEHLMAYNLDFLGKKYLGMGKTEEIWDELARMFGGRATRNAQAENLQRAPMELVGKYAKQDTRVTLDLWEWQRPVLIEQELTAVHQLECALIPVLLDMEYRGVRVNVSKVEQTIDEVTIIVDEKQKSLNKLAGFPVNPNPSGSIHKLFEPKQDKDGTWIANDGTRLTKTGAGKASINADALRLMKHPAAAEILALRKLLKTRDTFLKGHILGHHNNGIIHCNYNQTKSENDLGTSTGRLSINSPALQQIHKRDKAIASIVRSLFLPDEGQQWNCRDWSQMDFRVAGHYVNADALNTAYAEDPDADFHQMIADMTGLPRTSVPEIKGNAKQINLGLLFGMGEGKLAMEMGLPYTEETYTNRKGDKKTWLKPGPEAEEIASNYHGKFPEFKVMLGKASSIAKSRGYVKTVMGRRLRFPKGMFTHKAGGLIFQGSAADALKAKLVEVHNYLKGTDGRLLLNVHDEFDSSLPKGDVKLDEGIREIVEHFDGINTLINFRVPIRSDSGVGPDWWEASK